MKNKIYIIGWILCLVTITGGLLKILHLPGAGIMLTFGLTFLALVFFPLALISNFKSVGNKHVILYVVLILAIICQIAGALFKIQHWPGAGFISVAGILSPIVLFLPVYLYYHFTNEKQSLANFFSIIFLLIFFSVFDTLLTLRLSKSAIEMPIEIMSENNLDTYYNLKINQCYIELQNDSSSNDWIKKLKEIRENSNEYHQIIKTTLNRITEITNGKKFEEMDDLYSLNYKDNTSIPARGFNFETDNKDGLILPKLLNFKKSLLLAVNEKSSTYMYISDLLDTKKSANTKNWDESEFRGSPVIYALFKLKQMEDNAYLAEIETLKYIGSKGKY